VLVPPGAVVIETVIGQNSIRCSQGNAM